MDGLVAAMNLAAGPEMKAFVSLFLTFCDGQIVSQRIYGGYLRFEAAATERMSSRSGSSSGERLD